jgi:hypothetical protein
MSALGRLSVSLGLDAAEFTNGLTKAEYVANKFASSLGFKVTSGMKVAGAAIAATAGVASGFIVVLDKLNKQVAQYQDLAEMVGETGGNIASLQTAADAAGVSIDAIAGSMNKLTKGLSGADEETKGAAQGVKALGLELSAFKKLSPVEQFEALAKAFEEFEDGPEKTAVAMALWGKSGAENLKLVKAFVDVGGRVKILTDEQIKAADEYADKQAVLISQTKQYLQAMATQALPVLNAVLDVFLDLVKGFGGVNVETGKLDSTKIAEWAKTAAVYVAKVADAFVGVSRTTRVAGTAIAAFLSAPVGNWEALKRHMEGVKEDMDAILLPDLPSQSLEKAFEKMERERAKAAESAAAAGPGKPKKKLTFDPDAAKEAADLAKAQLDKQLSDLANFIKAEDRLLSQRESMLERAYANDNLSIRDYFAARTAVLEENLQRTAELVDKQIALLEKSAAGQKGKERESTLAKIGDLRESRSAALGKGQEQLDKLSDDRKRAIEAYGDQVDEVRAKVLELQGTEEAAAQAALIRFDIQNRALRRRATAEGDSETLAGLNALSNREQSQIRINALLKDADKIQQALANTEARLHLENDIGLRGEIQTLAELGTARAASAEKLQEIARRYMEIARLSGDRTLIQQAEAFRIKIDELAASADVLAEKFRGTFADSFASAFDGFVQGTLTARQAVNAFVTDVLSQINRMLANEAAMAIFGKGGIAGGLATGLASIFGGGFADGGSPPVGKISVVGERGPELFVPSTSGRIIPNHSLGGSTVEQNITFVLPSQVTKSTQNQIASRTLIAAQRAMSRGVAS